MTLAGAKGFEMHARTTRKAEFPARMEALVPWAEFCALVEPHYPKAAGGGPTRGMERMLRMNCIAIGFNLADEACEDALYDSAAFRDFCVVDATLIAAPPSTRNAAGERDPQMRRSKKGNRWHFGMKLHIGVDSQNGLIHSTSVTAGVRYRGLSKNANRAFAMLALINLSKWGRPLEGQERPA